MPFTDSAFLSAIKANDIDFIKLNHAEMVLLTPQKLAIFLDAIITNGRYYFLLHLHEMGVDLNSFKNQEGSGLLDHAAASVSGRTPALYTAFTLVALRAPWGHLSSSNRFMDHYANDKGKYARNRTKVETYFLSSDSQKESREFAQNFFGELYFYACRENLIKCMRLIISTPRAKEFDVRMRTLTDAELEAKQLQRRTFYSSFSVSRQANMLRGLTRAMMARTPEEIREEKRQTESTEQARRMAARTRVEFNSLPSFLEDEIEDDSQYDSEDEEKAIAVSATQSVEASNTRDRETSEIELNTNTQPSAPLPTAENSEMKAITPPSSQPAIPSDSQEPTSIININFKDGDGLTALHIAAATGQLDIVEELIKLKIIYQKNHDEEYPHEFAKRNISPENNRNILEICAKLCVTFTIPPEETKAETDTPQTVALVEKSDIDKSSLQLTGLFAINSKRKFVDLYKSLPDAYQQPALARVETHVNNKNGSTAILTKNKLRLIEFKQALQSSSEPITTSSNLTPG